MTKMEEEKERKKYIQLLLEKRKNNMSYLKRIHEKGQIHWMNVVWISPPDFGEDIQKRYVVGEEKEWRGQIDLKKEQVLILVQESSMV